jgi:hypothetical protein
MHKVAATDSVAQSRCLITEMRTSLKTMQAIIRRSGEKMSSNESELVADSDVLLAKVDKYILIDMNQSLR